MGLSQTAFLSSFPQATQANYREYDETYEWDIITESHSLKAPHSDSLDSSSVSEQFMVAWKGVLL